MSSHEEPEIEGEEYWGDVPSAEEPDAESEVYWGDVIPLRKEYEPSLTRADVERLLAQAGDASLLDLSGLNLERADLSQMNLARVNLERASLRGADLRGTILVGARLAGADLTAVNATPERVMSGSFRLDPDIPPTDFSYACLQDSTLYRANVNHALFMYADLQRANLTGVQASYTAFHHADMQGATLRQGQFSGSNFQSALLQDAHGERGWFYDVIFRDAVLDRADLEGAYVWKGDLRRASLDGCHLEGTDFWEVNGAGASLQGAHLHHAVLFEAQLEHANFTDADLSHARLNHADLREAVLIRADLREARLSCADLRMATLTGSDLRSARLRGARWQGAVLQGVTFADPDSAPPASPAQPPRAINEVQVCYQRDSLLFRWQVFPFADEPSLLQSMWRDVSPVLKLCWLVLNGRFAEIGEEAPDNDAQFLNALRMEYVWQGQDSPLVVEVRLAISLAQYFAAPLAVLEERVKHYTLRNTGEEAYAVPADIKDQARFVIWHITGFHASQKQKLVEQLLVPAFVSLHRCYHLMYATNKGYLTSYDKENLFYVERI
ncbi:MAG: pentapeptide repeat-containing protein [Ktedonobacteraceae bacterium]|nr:pentapeptide repeat-containing protein [Ktedonobacteraceae bacterium]